MSLALILRNTAKFNSASFLKTARLTPLKTYTTIVAAQRSNAARPLALVKNLKPLWTRQIATTVPKLAAAGTNHATIWTIERVVSLALLGLIPAPFLIESKALDAAFAAAIILHAYWGMEAMVVDYMRPAVVGPILGKAAHVALFVISITALGGLFYLIFNDIGFANSLKQLWAIKGKQDEPVVEPEPEPEPKGKKGKK